MALTYLNSKMIEEPATLDQLYVTSLTALSTTIQNTLTNDLTAINVTGDSVISVDTPGNALRITQRGIGNALVVEDSANPDSTPFVVNSLGRVGIGVASPTTELDVNGTIKGNTILGTNVNVTNTGTFQTVDATSVTTQNVIFPQSGGGSIVNNASFFGNLTIYGAISALSGLSVTSTSTSQTSSLSVVNTGPDVALFVSQGPNLSGVATFIGSGTEVLKVNNPNPNPNNLPAVVVNGVLSASGGTSTDWNSVYTNVQSNSANYVLQGGNTLAADLSVGTTNTRNLVLETNSIERMRIDSSGNVGIGKSNPAARLDVQCTNTTDTITNISQLNGIQITGNTASFGQTGIGFTSGGGGGAAIIFSRDNSWGTGISFATNPNTTGTGGATTPRVTITGAGLVGIGTTGPDQLLSVNGNASKVSGGSWAVFSDERVKTDITLADTTQCYNIVKNLPLKRFTYRDNIFSIQQAQDRTKLGWIAQDVQPIFPKAIYKHDQIFSPTGLSADNVEIKDCLTLDGDQIYAAMYGAIQKLISVVETQSATISALENRIQTLETQ